MKEQKESKIRVEYTVEVQKLFLRMMVTNAELFTRVVTIVNPANFDKSLRPVVALMQEHTDKYSAIPDSEQIRALTNVLIEPIPELTEGHNEWFLDEFENFTKRQELERAILLSADLLEKGDFDPVEKLIKDAVQISLMRDMGTDYFADPEERLNRYFSSGGQVSTGWPQLDRIMYGGFSRGELNIFSGGSGTGKSLVMMNIALNWLQTGLSGVYITLELSETLTSLRTDAMLTNTSTKQIRKDVETTALMVSMAGKKAGTGKYRVKGFPAQSNVNHIRSYLKEVQIQTGIKVDFIMVDYLDLLMPVTAKVNPNDLFVKDKYVSEELRNLAIELNVLMITASQLNRTAVDEIEFDHSHISGGISKINTADNVFGIFTSRSMRERGKYQLQCMKSRSSTGVGQKIDLEYNVDTMRITDEDPENQTSFTPDTPAANITDMIDKMKSNSGFIADPETGEIINPSDIKNKYVSADVQGSKLHTLLKNIKK